MRWTHLTRNSEGLVKIPYEDGTKNLFTDGNEDSFFLEVK
jgi:hypothetical protein